MGRETETKRQREIETREIERERRCAPAHVLLPGVATYCACALSNPVREIYIKEKVLLRRDS